MSVQQLSQPSAEMPLVSCPICEKKPLMVIRSVTPRGRTRTSAVQFVCAGCGSTHEETVEI